MSVESVLQSYRHGLKLLSRLIYIYRVPVVTVKCCRGWLYILPAPENIENVESALFEFNDSNDSGAGNSQKGDGKTVLGDSRMSSGDSNL